MFALLFFMIVCWSCAVVIISCVCCHCTLHLWLLFYCYQFVSIYILLCLLLLLLWVSILILGITTSIIVIMSCIFTCLNILNFYVNLLFKSNKFTYKYTIFNRLFLFIPGLVLEQWLLQCFVLKLHILYFGKQLAVFFL